LIRKNPFYNITIKKDDEEKKVRALTTDEIIKFEEAIKSSYYYEYFITQLDTGTRCGELLALTWDDIDFEKRRINIDKTLIKVRDKRGKQILQVQNKPKTNASKRIIPLSLRLIPILQELKQKNRSDELVFCSKNGTLICPNNIRRTLRKISEKMGIDPIATHVLRHSFTTQLFDLGIDIKSISGFLGHSKVEHTYNIYTHISEGNKDETITKYDKFLEKRNKDGLK
jgi:integrase